MDDARVSGLAAWAREVLPGLDTEVPEHAVLVPVSDDASFRRYFRFDDGAEHFVFVDAPPEHEDNESFIKVSAALVDGGLNSPRVYTSDLDRGYLAITDLGDLLFLEAITTNPDEVTALYDDAIESLLVMIDVKCDLPPYDEGRLKQEMSLFPDWFLAKKLKHDLTSQQKEMLTDVEATLVQNALEQPQVFVHRDYHCRNLMVVADKPPGIIDFQDAVIGPITYDLVSLFKDCYYRFEREEVVDWVGRFQNRLQQMGRIPEMPEAQFLKWFDLMGVQRHLKCAGIFSRLHLRDGKPRYLQDIPLVVAYLSEACSIYPELGELGAFLDDVVSPRMKDPEFCGEGAS